MPRKDINTSNRIKAAASRLFTEKGFGRTTTRQIAAEARVNLALVNYHFRSKEELFHEVMLEVVRGFIGQLRVLLNDDLSFEKRVGLLVDNYISLLKERPDLPIFMLSELRNHPEEIAERLHIEGIVRETVFFKELTQRCPEGIPPIHLFINLLSMTVFPFIAKPMITAATGMGNTQFDMAMEMRRELIPKWFMAMLRPPK